MGETGVRLCLEIMAKELRVTRGLCGSVDRPVGRNEGADRMPTTWPFRSSQKRL
jgi:hypothetical protein